MGGTLQTPVPHLCSWGNRDGSHVIKSFESHREFNGVPCFLGGAAIGQWLPQGLTPGPNTGSSFWPRLGVERSDIKVRLSPVALGTLPCYGNACLGVAGEDGDSADSSSVTSVWRPRSVSHCRSYSGTRIWTHALPSHSCRSQNLLSLCCLLSKPRFPPVANRARSSPAPPAKAGRPYHPTEAKPPLPGRSAEPLPAKRQKPGLDKHP